MKVRPFTAAIPDAAIAALRMRLADARWPDALADADWSLGTEPGFLRRVCSHWADEFDWTAAQARLNQLPQFLARIDELDIHFVHARSERADAIPLLLMNGWPSSIFEYRLMVPKLTGSGFHVVAPALPGYGFSQGPRTGGVGSRTIASLFVRLLEHLGYNRFIGHGSDIGAGVLEQMRRRFPEKLLGAHFSNVHWAYPRPADPTPSEQAYFEATDAWAASEGAYAALQRTKPQTLAYGLNDSPLGLAAWILEKLRSWSDGDLETTIGLDELCANLTLYWVTGTIGSSVRLYAESARDPLAQTPPAARGTVPAGVIRFPRDIMPAPRDWGERWLNLVHWTEAERGGHFPAWEVPDALADDLAAFSRTVCGKPAEAPEKLRIGVTIDRPSGRE